VRKRGLGVGGLGALGGQHADIWPPMRGFLGLLGTADGCAVAVHRGQPLEDGLVQGRFVVLIGVVWCPWMRWRCMIFLEPREMRHGDRRGLQGLR